jgi:hypothetical protein
MSGVDVSFTHGCPRCGFVSGSISMVGGGDATVCPSCGAQMVPVDNPNVADALAGFTCGHCGLMAGGIVSVGAALTNCPGCGAPIP